MTVRLDTAKLDHIIATFPKDAADTVRAGANQVQARATNLAPFDTGYLKSTIEAEPAGELTWHVVAGADYAIYQELGTSRMRAHPFMVPAVEITQKEYTQMWVALFNRL